MAGRAQIAQHFEWKGGIMRINEGNYAYEVRQNRDPLTQLSVSWDFLIFVSHPVEKLIQKGSRPTREEAEQYAKQRVAEIANDTHPRSPAAW